MLLQDKETGNLVEINDVLELIDPNKQEIVIQSQSGEEEQDPEPCHKSKLMFPSGESLPRCWVEANYRSS
jgi:hypothetical protein